MKRWTAILFPFFLIHILPPCLFANSSNTVVVPDVTGIKVEQAKHKLESKGFRVEVFWGDPAPSEEDSFKVYEQSLYPFLKVEQGQKIILTAFDKFKPQSTGKKDPERESGDPLDALFDVLDDFQKKDDKKKRFENEQQNETSGHSIRGDELPPEMKKPKAK